MAEEKELIIKLNIETSEKPAQPGGTPGGFNNSTFLAAGVGAAIGYLGARNAAPISADEQQRITNAQGPPGAQGGIGPQGPPGPSGGIDRNILNRMSLNLIGLSAPAIFKGGEKEVEENYGRLGRRYGRSIEENAALLAGERSERLLTAENAGTRETIRAHLFPSTPRPDHLQTLLNSTIDATGTYPPWVTLAMKEEGLDLTTSSLTDAFEQKNAPSLPDAELTPKQIKSRTFRQGKRGGIGGGGPLMSFMPFFNFFKQRKETSWDARQQEMRSIDAMWQVERKRRLNEQKEKVNDRGLMRKYLARPQGQYELLTPLTKKEAQIYQEWLNSPLDLDQDHTKAIERVKDRDSLVMAEQTPGKRITPAEARDWDRYSYGNINLARTKWGKARKLGQKLFGVKGLPKTAGVIGTTLAVAQQLNTTVVPAIAATEPVTGSVGNDLGIIIDTALTAVTSIIPALQKANQMTQTRALLNDSRAGSVLQAIEDYTVEYKMEQQKQQFHNWINRKKTEAVFKKMFGIG